MTLHRHWGLGLTALALVAALVWGFMPRPVPVDVAAAGRGPLRVTVEEEGRTRVIDRYVVSAPVAGYVQRIQLRVGDAVVQCQTLAELEPLRSAVLDPRSRAEAEARVAAAQAAVLAAEQTARAAVADAQIAQKDYERRKALFKDGRISREEHDRAEAAARRAEATRRSSAFAVEVARHELEAARTALEYSAAQSAGAAAPERVAVQSPVAGRVLRVLRESEGVVASGQPLIEIGDPAALEVEIEVLSADAVRIRPGMRVEFSRWGGDGILEGRVRVIEPTGFTKVSALGVEEQRVLVIADITSPPEQWSRLGDGYRVEASFILWEGDDVLQIPASALFRHGDGWAVFTLDAGRAHLAPVTVGHSNGFAAQIVDGMTEGAPVIVHPSDAIADGVRVAPRG
ncbi:MAG: efflux RND transporter periplasmic adaptor subunit [Gammaproteobacteria bacterium]|nr:efflux RND transporter periplasmic adaptor subunit [Gammaproteobacteria bacterium]